MKPTKVQSKNTDIDIIQKIVLKINSQKVTIFSYESIWTKNLQIITFIILKTILNRLIG